jgi:hypothetical protein
MNEEHEALFAGLSEPFPSDVIEWRVGSTNKDKTSCLPLAYIDARAAQDRFDAVCGPYGWQSNYTPTGNDASIICNIGVKVGSEWIWRANGAGKTDFEAEKGMYSDAFKRAAVMFGVGRYLYDIKAPWVPIENGKYLSEASLKKLKEFYEDYGARTAGWGSRAGGQVFRLLAKVMKDYVTDAATAQEFKEANKGEIALLPVAMKRHLLERLDRVGAPAAEAAE